MSLAMYAAPFENDNKSNNKHSKTIKNHARGHNTTQKASNGKVNVLLEQIHSQNENGDNEEGMNNLADFELSSHMYSISPELNEPMKRAFTTMIYVARLFGMYESIDSLYNLSNAPPLKVLPPLNSFTNPMWDANTLILVDKIL